jgi:hypothetical protein
MADEIFKLVAKTGQIQALGIDVDAKVPQVKVFINGIDVTKSLLIDEIKIIVEKVS